MKLRDASSCEKDLPRVGRGRGFAIAESFFKKPDILIDRPWLAAALTYFDRALEQQNMPSSGPTSGAEFWGRLNSRFDLDGIVSFSHAWHIWENIGNGIVAESPWDQELFFGQTAYSPDYHCGIKALAQRQLDFVVPACRSYFKSQVQNAIDIGAGLGTQMSALRAEGIVSSATCIDTPFVSGLGKEHAPEHTWIGGDLRNLATRSVPSADLLWIGNLLHHYDLAQNFGILNRFAAKLTSDAAIVIQDYIAGSPGLLGLAAASLGIHFAITTNEGRNYSERCISALIEEVFQGYMLDSRADGQFSSLLFYRRR